jgi:hypothetical protein
MGPLVGVVAVLALASCGDDGSRSAEPPRSDEVSNTAASGITSPADLSGADLERDEAFWTALSEQERLRLVGIYQRMRGHTTAGNGEAIVTEKRFDPEVLVAQVNGYYDGSRRHGGLVVALQHADRVLIFKRLRAKSGDPSEGPALPGNAAPHMGPVISGE